VAYHEADTNKDGVVSPAEKAAWEAANPGRDFGSGWTVPSPDNGFKTPFGTIRSPDPFSDPAAKQRTALNEQVKAAGGFANVGEQGFGAMGREAAGARDYLRQIAEGQNSVSAEQLRQGLQQNLATQRSMAASASPANAAMAARTAAMQGARLGYGMSGQQALAGLQERQQAQQMLNEMILRQRQQELEAALGARSQAIQGLTGQVKPEKTWWEQYGPAVAGAAGLVASDKRLKEDIEDADDESRRVIDGLKAYSFRYRDEKHGKGKQLGVMAQDLESAGLGHAVLDTPEGKLVHGAKLATSNTAMIAALGRRLAKLERERG
jgi:hypothetical protein